MKRKKTNNFLASFTIFFTSIKTFFLYFDQTAKYLAFPIFGQIFGILLIFTITYFFQQNIDSIKNISPFFNNEQNLLYLLLIILLPFFIIFIKAMYEYIIAFCSLNLVFYTNSNKKRPQFIDFKANKKVIERKLTGYILLMLIISLICTIPPVVFAAPIIMIFLCLSFQVFAFEPDSSAIKSLSRSIELVKGNVIATIILLLLCYLLTYQFLPNLFIWASDKISLYTSLIGMFETFIKLIDLNSINQYLSILNYNLDSTTIAKFSAEILISFIVISFTLPFRCCCFTELYKLYDSEKIKEFSKESDEIIRRATGKKRKN